MHIDQVTLGLRAATVVVDKAEHFRQYEVFAIAGLPWLWGTKDGWALDTNIEITAGVLSGETESHFLGSVGPGVELFTPLDWLMLNAGVRAAYLAAYEYRREDFGGPLQFLSHLGLEVRISDKVGIGYRIQHMSNARCYDQNPGLDMHMIQISYLF